MIFPLWSESYIRRFPILTVSLIAINFSLFFFSFQRIKYEREKIIEMDLELRKFEYSIYLRYYDEFSDIAGESNIIKITDFVRNSLKEKLVKIKQEDYEKWEKLYNNFESFKKGLFIRKVGFIPKKFNFFSLISSIFIHGGWMHIIGNMWFLFLVGINIEDIWGRVFFLGFYLVSGIMANIFHMILNYSDIPLIGASGAVAGVMGAFTFRFFKNKIKMFFFFPPIFASFTVIAGVIFPLWFLQQLINAIFIENSNVAFWAHVGGFLFGVIVTVFLKYSNVERKFIEPKIEEAIDTVDKDFREGIEKIQSGEKEAGIESLINFIKKNPNNVDAYIELSKAYYDIGGYSIAVSYFKKLIDILYKQKNYDLMIEIFNDYMMSEKLQQYTTLGDIYKIVDVYKKKGDLINAKKLLVESYKRYKDNEDAPIILLKLIKILVEAGNISQAEYVYNEITKRFPKYEEQAKAFLKGGSQ